MSSSLEHLDVVVANDGSVPSVSSADVARLGARPGEHLRLVRSGDGPHGRRRRVRGILVGKVNPDEVISDDDFAEAKRARIQAAEHRYGSIE